jgi:hypothetical protein
MTTAITTAATNTGTVTKEAFRPVGSEPGEPEVPPPHRPEPAVPITRPLPDAPITPLLPETPGDPTEDPPTPVPEPSPG